MVSLFLLQRLSGILLTSSAVFSALPEHPLNPQKYDSHYKNSMAPVQSKPPSFLEILCPFFPPKSSRLHKKIFCPLNSQQHLPVCSVTFLPAAADTGALRIQTFGASLFWQTSPQKPYCFWLIPPRLFPLLYHRQIHTFVTNLRSTHTGIRHHITAWTRYEGRTHKNRIYAAKGSSL
mgnify:CR=1 FL=1